MSDEKSKEQLIAEATAFQDRTIAEYDENYNENKSKIEEEEKATDELISKEHHDVVTEQLHVREEEKERRELETFGSLENLSDPLERIYVPPNIEPFNNYELLKLQRTGIDSNNCIPSDIDKVQAELDTTIRLLQQFTIITDDVELVCKNITDSCKKMYTIIYHFHNYHHHKSVTGHGPDIGYETIGNGGPFYPFGGSGFKLLIEMLQNEMNNGIDIDGNNKCYYHDFIFDTTDTTVPIGMMLRQMSNFHMPGKPKYNTKLPNSTIVTSTTPMLYDKEYETIQIGFDESDTEITNTLYKQTTITPVFVDRLHTVEIWTWEQYLNSIRVEIQELHNLVSFTTSYVKPTEFNI